MGADEDRKSEKSSGASTRTAAGAAAAILLLFGLVAAAIATWPEIELRRHLRNVRDTRLERLRDARERASIQRSAGACAEAAGRGDRRAMAAMVGLLCHPEKEADFCDAFKIAASDTKLFFDILEEKDDSSAQFLLWRLVNGTIGEYHWREFGSPGAYHSDVQISFFARKLKEMSGSQDADVRRVSTATLDFIRRRFAEKLAGDA